MSNITIEKVIKETWEEYKYLRTLAVTEDPQAFGDSIEEAANRTEEEWVKRIENPFTIILVAKTETKLAGMIAVHFYEHQKESHVAFIWGVYVSKEFRGHGIGKMLLEKVLEEIKKRPGIIKIELDVVTTQIPAKKMYEEFGFKTVGTLHKHLKVGEEFFDMDIMEKFI